MAEAPDRISTAAIAGGAGVLVVCLALIYVLVYGNVSKLNALREEQRVLSRELEELLQLGETVAAAELALASLEVQRDLLARQLPLTIDFSSFYGALAAASEGTGVTLDNVAPGTIGRGPEYLYLPVEIDVTGPFPQLYQFVHRVTHLPRLSKVERLSIVSTDDPGACTLSLTLHIFAAAPPPAPEAAA